MRASAALALAMVWVLPGAANDLTSAVLVLDRGGARANLLAVEPLLSLHVWPLRGVPVLHPLVSADGRHIYFLFADGWVMQFEVQQRRVSAEVQTDAGITAAALSSDGQWLALATGQPPRLEVYDRQLQRRASHAAATLNRVPAQRIDMLADAPQRQSFVASLEGIPELWELSYNPGAGPIFDGLVHDFRMAEAIAKPGFLGVRRTPLAMPMSVFALDHAGPHVLAMAQPGATHVADPATGLQADVIHLDIRRRITDVPLAARPDSVVSGLGVAFASGDGRRLAWLGLSPATLEVVDVRSWRKIASRRLGGLALALRAPVGQSSLWAGLAADPFEGSGKYGAIALIDKDTLNEVARLSEPGHSFGPWAMTHDGARAVVPVIGESGEVLVLNAQTLKVLQRLPMDRPTSAYTVPAMIKTTPDNARSTRQ